jgi:hypothetical protein
MKMGNFICKGVPKSENKNMHTIKNERMQNEIIIYWRIMPKHNSIVTKIDKFG